ncbi:TNT domain-containing protein [Gordonia sp. CPCC 206044]|uniref:TNT domain-containing protein n=1 Tax=Gordonia sp. CPCC 206044 TaxID=3140793 RepID=UPI003AF393E1
MTTPVVEVRPASFGESAKAFEEARSDIRGVLDSLYLALGASGQMAGSDRSGRMFAQSYDKTVNGDQSLLAGIALMGNACGKMAELLDASAVNHTNVDNAIGVCSPTNPSGNPKNLESIPVVSNGSSFGGPGEPSNWEKLKEFIQGEIFPDGDPSKLEQAGSAWTRAATDLRNLQQSVDSAIAHIAHERSAEVEPAQDQAGLIKQHLGGIADSCDAVAKLCNEFATNVRETRESIGDEVKELSCELLAAAAIGIALTLVTGGLSDLLATAAGVAKATQTGARIATMIRGLSLVAGRVVRPLMYVLDPVGAAAGDLGALMGSRAAMFSMEMSRGSVRAAELTQALRRLPTWAHDELKRAVDPDFLRKSMEQAGIPKNVIDDAVANNPYRNMTPDQIVDRYWNTSTKGWDYPPNQGFSGNPHVSNSIPAGTELDRIGGESGEFLGREGDSYGARALSPGNANAYHEYVATGHPLRPDWEVRDGPIASAFGQPGGGHQWVLVDTKTGKAVSIEALKRAGVIRDG